LHRDESRYPGTGIGLSLAKRIAESHNGSIELDTTFQGGARFIVTLPEAPKAED
jgi:signal transduction histidine kinase